jgi:hypothetical protein
LMKLANYLELVVRLISGVDEKKEIAAPCALSQHSSHDPTEIDVSNS